MNKVWRLALREYIASVKTKGFIVGLVLAPVLMSGSVIAILLLKDNVDLTDKRIAVIDYTGRVAASLAEDADNRNAEVMYDKESGEKIRPAYLVEIVEPDTNDTAGQLLALSNRVRAGDLHAILEIPKPVLHPGQAVDVRSQYYGRNAAMDDVRGWITFPLNNQLRRLRLEDAGIAEEQVPDLFYWINIQGLGLVSMNTETCEVEDARKASEIEGIIVPIAIMMIMMLMIMMSVPGMLHSVMEEKTQRIAEVLLGSVKPFEFMMGKILGGIGVSLTSSLVYIAGGFYYVYMMGWGHFLPYHVLPWLFAYMLLAIIMFGAWSAALGATCSEAKDAQSLTFPSILPALIPMFIYFPVVKEPLSSFSTWMSLIPPFTPLLMTLRMATPEEIPIWQPAVGLVGVILFTFLFVWLGSRIFRMAILLQGTPPKLANMVKWAARG